MMPGSAFMVAIGLLALGLRLLLPRGESRGRAVGAALALGILAIALIVYSIF